MRRFVYQLVDRLHDASSGLSRNRQPAVLDTPAGRRALRLHRHLASLDADLAAHPDTSVELVDTPTGLQLRATIPGLKLTRVAVLSADDLDVIAAHPGALHDLLASRGRLAIGPR